MNSKPRLLVLSQVLPFPGAAGQQQRVAYKLRALRPYFHLTFLTAVPLPQVQPVQEKLLEHCDEALVIPSLYSSGLWIRLYHRLRGLVFILRSGLKFSNYLIGQLEFAPRRLEALLQDQRFDCVLFEYWHAAGSLPIFIRRGIPCVLDMHDLLWQSYSRQLEAHPWLPGWLRKWAVERYRRQEEAAWAKFDVLIAINRAEYEYTRQRAPENVQMFYAPMGVDLERWPYSYQPASPPRLAYYGGLGSPHNQRDALFCYQQVMPLIWERAPQAELWIVGSNPPASLKELERDPRVKVTGYVEHVQEILRTITAVLCPWSGTYGFRSRLVEVMALGVPVVASPDAVHGMGLVEGQGLLLGQGATDLAQHAVRLIQDPGFAAGQSRQARLQVEASFSFEASYGQWAIDLISFITHFQGSQYNPSVQASAGL